MLPAKRRQASFDSSKLDPDMSGWILYGRHDKKSYFMEGFDSPKDGSGFD